ncbi:MAG TPA: hypothetical protein VGV92_02005 [Gammaproteobacteria bacterium]|nr:hypothetical protein [Gammaproteobacteria bacterium]
MKKSVILTGVLMSILAVAGCSTTYKMNPPSRTTTTTTSPTYVSPVGSSSSTTTTY